MKVLGNRQLLIIAGAEVISNLGNWIAMQAIFALLIFDKGGGVAQSAAIYLAGLGPTMLLGPVAGWLVDRCDRRRLMIASELLSGLVIACMIFATRVELIYLLLVLASICGTVMAPARGSAVPDLVEPAELTRANAFMQQVNGLTRIGAPLAGAAIVASVTPQTALLIDVVSFLLSAIILRFLPAMPPRAASAANREAKGKPSLLKVLQAVMREVPILRVLLPFMLVLGCVIMAYDISSSVYVRDVMEGSIAMKGLLASLIGLGMGIASLALMLIKGERNLERDYVAGLLMVIGLPLSFALGDLSGSPALARAAVFLGCLLGGLGIGIANVQGATLIQRHAPPGWLGRLNGATQSVFTAGQVTGMLATPLLIPSVVSFGVYFGVGTLILLLISIRTIFSLSRGRRAGSTPANEVAIGD